MVSIDDVRAAAERLQGIANRTPVVTSRTLDGLAGAEVFLKAESFQRGGAFKFRGAYNRIAADPPERGVFAYSSGNHAQAVAIASELLGFPAAILMPTDTPATKLEATRGYGAEVLTYDRFSEDREELGVALAGDREFDLVRPYDDPLVMAGQGTTALELLEEVGVLDVLVTPVGGGGLIAGCATAAKALDPSIRVVGVEPETGDDTARSLAAGHRINGGVPRTIADGLQAAEPGELTFEVNRRLVDEIVTATDAEILDAMRFLFDRMKLVTEPSGAIGVAALLACRAHIGFLPGGPGRHRHLGRQRRGGALRRAAELAGTRQGSGGGGRREHRAVRRVHRAARFDFAEDDERHGDPEERVREGDVVSGTARGGSRPRLARPASAIVPPPSSVLRGWGELHRPACRGEAEGVRVVARVVAKERHARSTRNGRDARGSRP